MGLDTFRAYQYDAAMTLGEMWGWALERYIKSNMHALDFKTTEEWILFGDPTLQIAKESEPPNRPDKPSGTNSGKVGETYGFTSKGTDPDDDDIFLKFDWGDGTDSGWLGPLNSGETESATHKWNREGTFEVKVAAKDEHGKVGDWSSPLEVSISKKSRVKNTFLSGQFFENLPAFEKLLQLIPIINQLLFGLVDYK
jgi:hypothetical protein